MIGIRKLLKRMVKYYRRSDTSIFFNLLEMIVKEKWLG